MIRNKKKQNLKRKKSEIHILQKKIVTDLEISENNTNKNDYEFRKHIKKAENMYLFSAKLID